MQDKNTVATIQNPEIPLNDRISALNDLLLGGGEIVPVLLEQLKAELGRGDPDYVIYLFGAIRRIYDRQLVVPLMSMLRSKDVELTFRMQCVTSLKELYEHSVAGLDVIMEAVEAGEIDSPRVQHFLNTPHRLGEVFSVKGDALTDKERADVEAVLSEISADTEELPPLREEAEAALAVITGLKNIG